MQQQLFIHPQIFMAETNDKGRGMFTAIDLIAGAIIEHAPVIPLSATDRLHIDKTLLHDYIFEWNPDDSKMCCMALGNIPIYNHSYYSNCEYFMNYEQKTMYIQTVRSIKAGEELTINYNGDYNDKNAVWFDVF
jgi:hypothetical protein